MILGPFPYVIRGYVNNGTMSRELRCGQKRESIRIANRWLRDGAGIHVYRVNVHSGVDGTLIYQAHWNGTKVVVDEL